MSFLSSEKQAQKALNSNPAIWWQGMKKDNIVIFKEEISWWWELPRHPERQTNIFRCVFHSRVQLRFSCGRKVGLKVEELVAWTQSILLTSKKSWKFCQPLSLTDNKTQHGLEITTLHTLCAKDWLDIEKHYTFHKWGFSCMSLLLSLLSICGFIGEIP